MTRTLTVMFFGLCLPGLTPLLSGDGASPQKGQVSHTERVDFAPGGTIRFDHSFGDLYVEGWDRPEVDITLIKSIPKVELGVTQSPIGEAGQMESVRFTTQHLSPSELAITTTTGPRSFFRHPFGGKGPVTLRYELRVPSDSRLIIHHGGGNILVGNVTGGVEATNRNGDIVLMLPSPGAYSIDARSKLGTVSSDFAGQAHVRHLIGEAFLGAAQNSSRRVFLRVGFGGITIKAVPQEALP